MDRELRVGQRQALALARDGEPQLARVERAAGAVHRQRALEPGVDLLDAEGVAAHAQLQVLEAQARRLPGGQRQLQAALQVDGGLHGRLCQLRLPDQLERRHGAVGQAAGGELLDHEAAVDPGLGVLHRGLHVLQRDAADIEAQRRR